MKFSTGGSPSLKTVNRRQWLFNLSRLMGLTFLPSSLPAIADLALPGTGYATSSPPPALLPPAALAETIFTNQAPFLPDATDGRSYELGMTFCSSQAGEL